MANTIDASCPECQKKIKATEELQGKKVRCKGCNHVFVIPAAAAAKESKPAAVKKVFQEDDEDDGKGYGVSESKDTDKPRCPHCATELESDAVVICVNCGYNLKTRQRVGTKKVVEITAGDRMAWLMPGYACIVACFVLIGLALFYTFRVPLMVKNNMDWEWLDNKGFRVWVWVGSGLLMIPLLRFAFRRLILEAKPPERETEL